MTPSQDFATSLPIRRPPIAKSSSSGSPAARPIPALAAHSNSMPCSRSTASATVSSPPKEHTIGPSGAVICTRWRPCCSGKSSLSASHNFTLDDLRAILFAFALFPLVVFVPGYVIAWLLDLFDFRRRTQLFRIALSIPLSISLCPILIYLLGNAPIAATWAGGAVLIIAGWRRKFSRPQL